MENLLKEFKTSSNTSNQTERLRKAHQVRNQEWVKQRRDEGEGQGNLKRRRFIRRADVSVDTAFASEDSTPLEVATTSQHSVYAVTVPTDKQPST